MRVGKIVSGVMAGFVAGASLLASTDVGKVAPPEGPAVDLVLCLDTSNSMDGLISAAKVKLWTIVNDLARAKPVPRLRVALFSYGNDGYRTDGWVRKDCDFTQDLDEIYAKLNALSTNGGTELVARVVREAAGTLAWTPDRKALKIVFVCGNESARQDTRFTLEDVFKGAIGQGIQVNTIFCGNPADGDAAGWRDAARLADGQYACIDHEHGTVTIATPMDGRLAELSGELNKTYIGYGRRAKEKLAMQEAQDGNAEGAAGGYGAAERACSKAGALYDCSKWDLVDAVRDGKDLGSIGEAELPEEMRKMDEAERETYVQKKTVEREGIQEKIRKLSREREEYIRKELAGKQGGADRSFDAAILKAIRGQAEAKGFRFE